MTVFVDSSAILALLNEADRYHELSIVQWRQLTTSPAPLVSNNYVLLETTALMQHRFGLAAVRDLQETFLPLIAVVWVDEKSHGQALAALFAARRRRLSLVDCSAMITMQSLGLKRIFTFDRHFVDYGFECIPDEQP